MGPDLLPGAAPVSEQTRALTDWLRDYARRRINSHLIDQRRTIPPYLVLDFGNRGLLGMQVPRAQGGQLALDHLAFVRVLRQLGGIDMTLASFVGLNNCLGVRPVLRHGSAALQGRCLPDLAAGRVLASFALSEAEAGSNPLGIAATARRRPGGFLLSGEKWWAGSAQWAGVLTVVARHLDDAGRDRGFVALCVDGNQPGLRHGEEALTAGLRGMVQNRVHFDAVQVDDEWVLGSPYAGMAVVTDTMAFGRLAVAAAAVGAIWRALQWMVRYADRRRIGGGRLYENDHAQSVIADTWLAAVALDRLVERMAQALDHGTMPPLEVFAAAKLLASELLWQAADAAMQMLGGRGYCDNNPAAQLLRDARVTRIFEGPSETLACYLGQRLLQGAPGLLLHLATTPEGEHQLGQLRQDCESLRGRGPRKDSLETPSPRGLIALGETAAWSVLAACCGGAAAPLTAWLKRRRRLAAARLADSADLLPLPPACALAELISAQVGDVQQTQAGEHSQLDPYLHD